jgi:hypothetical protein
MTMCMPIWHWWCAVAKYLVSELTDEDWVILNRCINQRVTLADAMRAIGVVVDANDPRYYDAATWQKVDSLLEVAKESAA